MPSRARMSSAGRLARRISSGSIPSRTTVILSPAIPSPTRTCLAATLARSRTLIAARRVDFHIGRFGGWRRADRIIAVSDAAKHVLIGDGIAGDRITVGRDRIDPQGILRASRPALGLLATLCMS